MKNSFEENVPFDKKFLQQSKISSQKKTKPIDGEQLIHLLNEDTFEYEVLGLESDHCYFASKNEKLALKFIDKV